MKQLFPIYNKFKFSYAAKTLVVILFLISISFQLQAKKYVVTGIDVSSQNGTVTYGTAGSVTYTLTLGESGNGAPSNSTIFSLTWTPPTGVTFTPTGSVTLTGDNQTVTLTLFTTVNTPPGTYNFVVHENDNSKNSSSVTFIVQKRALSITANNLSKCVGTTYTFLGTEFTSVGLVNSDAVTSVTLTSTGSGAGAAVGSYSIVPSAAIGSGLSNYTITYYNGTLTVNPLPQGSLAGNTICTGGTGQFTYTSSSGTSPFTLIISGQSYSNITNGTPFNANPNPSSTTSYTLTSITDANSCVRTSGITGASATITVNSIPSAPTAGNNGPVCEGNSLSLTASTISGATYSWTGPNGYTSSVQNPTVSSSATISMAGTYSVTATVSGCTSPAGTTNVTVNTLPSTPTSPSASPSTICNGQSSTLSATVGGGETVDWFTGSCGGTPVTSPVSPSSTTTYYARARNTTTGCISAACATVTVTVNTLPSTPTSPSASPSTICNGQSSTLSATVGGGETVDWFTGSCGGTPVTSPVSPSSTTTYYARARNTTTGCVSAACATVTLTVNSIPSAPTAGNNSPVCVGNSLSLTASTISGATYSWSGPNSFSSSDQNPTVSSSATLAMAGTYSVTATVSGCTSTAGTTSATVNALPNNGYTVSDPTVCNSWGTVIAISGSQAGVRYDLRYDSNNAVYKTENGTGFPITFTSIYLTDTTIFNVLATNTTTNCFAELTDHSTVYVQDIDAAAFNITQAAPGDSINGSSSGDICPDLIPPDFDPDNGNYKLGATYIDVRVERKFSSNNWHFTYSTYPVEATIISTTFTGNISTPTSIGNNVNAGDNDKVYIRFKVQNTTNTTINFNFTIDTAGDDVTGCLDQVGSDDDAYQTIKPLPALGPFE